MHYVWIRVCVCLFRFARFHYAGFCWDRPRIVSHRNWSKERRTIDRVTSHSIHTHTLHHLGSLYSDRSASSSHAANLGHEPRKLATGKTSNNITNGVKKRPWWGTSREETDCNRRCLQTWKRMETDRLLTLNYIMMYSFPQNHLQLHGSRSTLQSWHTFYAGCPSWYVPNSCGFGLCILVAMRRLFVPVFSSDSVLPPDLVMTDGSVVEIQGSRSVVIVSRFWIKTSGWMLYI